MTGLNASLRRCCWLVVIALVALALGSPVAGGSLTPPGTPGPTMVTLDEIKTAVDSNGAAVATVDTKVGAVDTKVGTVDTKVTSLQSSVSSVSTKVDGVQCGRGPTGRHVLGLDVADGAVVHILHARPCDRRQPR